MKRRTLLAFGVMWGLLCAVVMVVTNPLIQAQNDGEQVETVPGVQVPINFNAEFFNNPDRTPPSVGQTYLYSNLLNEVWGQLQPVGSIGTQEVIIPVGPDNFSARFVGEVELAANVQYSFTLGADDFATMTIVPVGGDFDDFVDDNGNSLNPFIVLDQQGFEQETRTGSFNAAGPTRITIEYTELTGNSQIFFEIRQGGGGQPTPTPQPAAVGNVVQVRGLALRSGPFLGSSLLAVARPDTQYPILAYNDTEGLFRWYYLQLDADTQGWSSGRFLDVTGNEAALPELGPGPFDRIEDPRGTVLGNTRSVMNFRTFPSERVPRIAELPQLFWGAEVEIIARTVQGGQDFWYQVRHTDPASGITYTGWILAAFVGLQRDTDPIDSVPIR